MVFETFSPPVRRRPPTILIIEDEAELSALLEESLTRAGYKTVLACNGIDGLAKLQDTEPDLILCDRVMPAMTGSDLLERLRNIYPQYKTVPFIFLTALTDEGDKAAVAHLKPYAYMEKPLNFDLLEKTIAQALAGT